MDFKAAKLPGEIISIEAFSHAIECIYDCALDPVRWTHAIDAISLAAPRQRDRIGQLAVSGHETGGAIANAVDGEATIGSAGIGIPAPQADGEPALIYMLPLMRGDIRGRVAPHAAAALFVTVKDGGASSFAEAIAAMFGLSAAEERTLERLLAGDTLAEAADTLGIAVTTVRTHLTHIFDKTGASRQAELIRLAAKFSPPCR